MDENRTKTGYQHGNGMPDLAAIPASYHIDIAAAGAVLAKGYPYPCSSMPATSQP